MISLLYQIPSCLQRLYRGVVWRADQAPYLPSTSFPLKGQGASLYLTFDDGPIPEMTPRILEILREKQVKATFFCVGDNVRKYPELLEAILADGHSVGNHTFHHLPGLQTSTEQYLRDVAEAEEIINRALPDHPRRAFASDRGSEANKELSNAQQSSSLGAHQSGSARQSIGLCPLFRPPYGRMRPSQKRALLRQGYTIVLWDVLTHDYNPRYSTDKLVRIVRRYTRPGSVVVFHDSLRSGERMLRALPLVIDFWRSEGYDLRPL